MSAKIIDQTPKNKYNGSNKCNAYSFECRNVSSITVNILTRIILQNKYSKSLLHIKVNSAFIILRLIQGEVKTKRYLL